MLRIQFQLALQQSISSLSDNGLPCTCPWQSLLWKAVPSCHACNCVQHEAFNTTDSTQSPMPAHRSGCATDTKWVSYCTSHILTALHLSYLATLHGRVTQLGYPLPCSNIITYYVRFKLVCALGHATNSSG